MGLNENKVTHASDPIADAAAHPESSVSGASSDLQETLDPTLEAFGLRKPPPDEGESQPKDRNALLHNISSGVNALTMLQSMPSQLLNTGLAEVPLLDKMPGMPAAVIGAAHLGTPHAHDHPPSDGIPLPSVGSTIGSGCLSVLIGGIPSARVLDLGIAPTCGGLTPLFDITTGSSNTFIGGMRAARMGIDQTRHCNPMAHVGKEEGEAGQAAEEGEQVASEAEQVTGRARVLGGAGKAWKYGNAALGPVSGVASSVDEATSGEGATAAMTAVQTAADAAMMALSNLMGKDPGIEPSMGMLMDGNPTVLIGGFPMHDSQMMWHGVKHGIGKKVKARRADRQNEVAPCRDGHPVDVVRGTAENEFVDYETKIAPAFKWERYYCSGWNEQDGALGFGFRHCFQHELCLLRTRAIYVDALNREYPIRRNADGRYEGIFAGYELRQHDEHRFVLSHGRLGDMTYERASEADRTARLVNHVRDGVESTLEYARNGALIRIVQEERRGLRRQLIDFRYDDRGHIVELYLTDPLGETKRIAHYDYDAAGCLAAFTDPLGAATSHGYDGRRRMIRETDANGYSFSYRYDSHDRCIESVGQDGLWQVALDYQPGRTVVTRADGGKWTFLYDEARTVTRIVDPYGGATERVIGDDGRILREIDPGGRVMRWLYDERGSNTGRMDRWGNRWPTRDEAPVLPNPLAHTVPATPLGLQWGDAKLEELMESVLLPPEIQKIAESLFQQSAFSSSEQHDAGGRVVARTDEHGGVERFRHDAAGNIVQRCDKDGREHHYGIASWSLRESETDPLGNTVRYRYSHKQEITAIVDANGNESAYTYDYKGRITNVMRHGVVRETYEYDSGDRVVRKNDVDGNALVRLEIGDHGLPIKRTLASGETHVYAYDRRGKVTKASTETFEVAIEHDVDGRLISDKRDGMGLARRYLANGSIHSTYFDRFIVRHESMSNGEISIHTPTGGVHRLLRDRGRVLLRLGSGVNRLHLFDPEGRCSGRLEWRDTHPAQLHSVVYEYSATGELRRVVDSAAGTAEYRYDLAHRVIGEIRDGQPVRRFDYDRGGNLLSNPELTWMRYAEGNRLASTSVARYRYNARNHLAEEIRHDGRHVAFHYDGADLLARVEWSDRDDVWTAKYDGLSRRLYKQMGDARTDYYWDGDRLAAEIGSKQRLRIYVYANEQALVPFMFIDYPGVGADPYSGAEYFVVSNQAGLPERIEDSAGREVWRAMETDPYGRIVVAPGNSVDYAPRWAGHHFDVETGLHYNRFRSYHPGQCRYLQTDPIGQLGGVNLYAYTANPLVFVDVTGLKCVTDGHKSTPEGGCEPSCFVESPEGEQNDCPVCKLDNVEGIAPAHIEISEEDWNAVGNCLREDRSKESSDIEIAEIVAKKLAKEALDSINKNLAKEKPEKVIDFNGVKLKALKTTAEPCLSIVIDKENRRAYFGQNQDWPPHFHTKKSDKLGEIKSDVLIRNRILRSALACKFRLAGKISTSCLDDWNHLHNNGVPGRHAEVHAVVAALRGRGDSNLGSLVLYNVKMAPKDVAGDVSRTTFGDGLQAMPRCEHCEPITKGVILHHDLQENEAAEKAARAAKNGNI